MIAAIGFASCSLLQTTKKSDIRHDILFQSAGNGVAEIHLLIKKNNTFTYFMNIIPQPNDKTNKPTVIKSNGSWERHGEWLRMKFKNKKLNVKNIFETQYADPGTYRLIDAHTVEVRRDSRILSIWGISCVRRD